MIMSPRFVAPLLAAASALFLAACGGGGADLVADATKVADVAPRSSFELIARGDKFNEKVLVANADTEIKISLSNQDGGVLHNFALYTSSNAKENLYRGELFEGKKVVDDTFTSPAAGVYFFRCDVHPDSMTGTFVTR